MGFGYRSLTSLIRSTTCILFCHSILFEVIFVVSFLINMSFSITSTNNILGLPLLFFFFLFLFSFLDFNQLMLPHWCIYRSPLCMIKPSQATILHFFINKGHPYFKVNFLILNSICPCISTYPYLHCHFSYTFYEHVTS